MGLTSIEVSRVRILIRLLRGASDFHWVYAPDAPFDAVLVGQDAKAPTGAIVIDVLPAGSQSANAALKQPIEVPALEGLLYKLQVQLQPTDFGGLYEIPRTKSAPEDAPPPLGSPGAPNESPLTVEDNASYKLTRWPPQVVLRDSKDRLRIANLISRNAFSVEEVVRSTGISKEEVQSFMTVLQSFGIVKVEISHGLTRDPSYAYPNTTPSQILVKRGLLSAIRRTLGI